MDVFCALADILNDFSPDPAEYVPAWHRLQLRPVVAPACSAVYVRPRLNLRSVLSNVTPVHSQCMSTHITAAWIPWRAADPASSDPSLSHGTLT